MSLALCSSCRRHVRVGESSCPFCGGSVFTEGAVRIALRPTRAAIIFAGAMGIAGCGDDHATVEPPYGAPYDAAAFDTSTQDSAKADTATGDTSATDSAAPDTATEEDTASKDTGGAVPPYGAPFVEDAGK